MKIRRQKYIEDLKNRMGNGMVKVITGVRRSGKSYLLFELFYAYLLESGVERSDVISVPLDEDRLSHLRDVDELAAYIRERTPDDSKKYYLLLDEVQYAISDEEIKSGRPPRIYDLLNGLLRRHNVDVYVTGSNSRFLSTDVMTEFRGRGDEVHVLPLSFSEFMQAYEGDIYHAWAEYSTYGGLPLLPSLKTDEQKIVYLKKLFEETYLKDIQARYKIQKKVELDDLINILASATGSLTNPHKICQTFKSVYHSDISEYTIANYIGYLQDAFIVNGANRYDVKGRRYIGSPSKYYFEDVGLRNARLNFRQMEENHVMENVIYNELRYRGYCVDVGVVERQVKIEGKPKRLYYEIDFVANKGSRRLYVQSAFEMSTAEKREQEKKSLVNLTDGFKRIIVVKDVVKPHYDDDGIFVVGLLDFLTQREWESLWFY